MIIDFHTHIFPEKIAEKTIEGLSKAGGTTAFSNGMADGLLSSMKEACVDMSVVLPVVTAPRQFESINRFALALNEAEYDGPRLMSFGGIHPESTNYKEELRWIADHGFKGIKIHPDYQGVFIDDIKYMRIIALASELGLAVVAHAGFDGAYPLITHCTPVRTVRMLEEVRPEKFILAHMGANERLNEVEEYLVGRDVYFDSSYVLDEVPREQLKRVIKNHGCDKILFATDSPWKPQNGFVKEMKSLCSEMTDIDKNIEEKIMGGNAKRVLGKKN